MERQVQSPWSEWKIIKEIGRGSFGAVYEIQREEHGDIEKGALKIIKVPHNDEEITAMQYSGWDNASITQNFQKQAEDVYKEYKLMTQLRDNPYIVSCQDYKEIQHDDGMGLDIYIRMELLTPLMKKLDALSTEDQIAKLGMDICKALVECQKKSIIHRDIKPQNVFISDSGNFKLGDFGIARNLEQPSAATVGIGTYTYMAPEVKNGQEYGNTVDIYSLGIMMYEKLNGNRAPFMPDKPKTGDKEIALNKRFTGEKIPAPKDGCAELKRIVLKACAFSPMERYASAAEMLADLEQMAGVGSNVVVPPKKEEELPRKQTDVVIPPQKQENERTVGVDPYAPVNKLEEQRKEQAANVERKSYADKWKAIKADPAPSVKPQVEQEPAEDPDATVGPQFDKRSNVFVPNPVTPNKPVEPQTPPVKQNVTQTKTQDEDATVGPQFNPNTNIPYNPQNGTNAVATKEKKKTPVLLFVGLGAAALVLILLLVVLLPGNSGSSSGDYDYDYDFDYDNGVASRPSAGSSSPAGTTSPAETTPQGNTTPSTGATQGNPPATSGSDQLPTQVTWSDWAEKLPSYVTSKDYTIEEKILYRSKRLETTSSTTSSTMSGWELFDTVKADGSYGQWSDWSETAVSTSNNRQVETQKRYRYRTKETTTSTSSSLSGWTLEKTTYTQGNVGTWSAWTTNKASETATRQVETKTQYSYRQKHYKTSNSNSPISGWTYSHETTTYGEWSNWSYSEIYGSSKVEVETRAASGGTQYRYRTKTITYHFYQFTAWSSFSDTPIQSSETVEVKTQTLYRFRTCEQIPVYHFYRWGGWSSWSTSSVSASASRQVENKTFYRFRERVQTTTYYFRRWTEWTAFSDGVVTPSDTVKVETKTEYRFKSK